MFKRPMFFIILICLFSLTAAFASAATMTGRVRYYTPPYGVSDYPIQLVYHYHDENGDCMSPGNDVTVQTDNDGEWSHFNNAPYGAVTVDVTMRIYGQFYRNVEFPATGSWDFGSYRIARDCPKCPNQEDGGPGVPDATKDLGEELPVTFGALKVLYR